jgi:hypothetical protein
MESVLYLNRYKDEIRFTEEDNKVTMTGAEYMRYGWDEDPEVITMVDPSGGPYITVGSDLQSFFRDGKERIIDKIKLDKGKVIFMLK